MTDEKLKTIVKTLFKDQKGDPIELTDLQILIFKEIFLKLHNRIWISCHTRFGKSLTVALAVLLRASIFPEKWGIVAPKKEQAKIIMGYINQHIFDNPFTLSKIVLGKGEKLEELKRHRNKNHITLKISNNQFSEIFIGSAKNVIGFGAENVILDEASLVEDEEMALVLRMLGDNPKNNFLVKIGNPFKRNHFLESSLDPNYHKILIDCWTSLKEGKRITKEIIDENKKYDFFSVLFECKFPKREEIDDEGFLYLFTETDLQNAFSRKNPPYGERRLGVDVARGGRNFSSFCLRDGARAEIVFKTREPDLVKTAEETINVIRKYSVNPKLVFVDDAGVGGGVTDVLKSRGLAVQPVNFAEKSPNEEFYNLKAFLYASQDSVLTFVRNFGQLVQNDFSNWTDLLKIKYQKNSAGKVVIESKERLQKKGIASPDDADALALTFYPKKITVDTPKITGYNLDYYLK